MSVRVSSQETNLGVGPDGQHPSAGYGERLCPGHHRILGEQVAVDQNEIRCSAPRWKGRHHRHAGEEVPSCGHLAFLLLL
jgi:hypothetical protein